MMQRTLWTCLLLVFLLATVPAVHAAGDAAAQGDRIAVVNGVAISGKALEQKMSEIRQQMSRGGKAVNEEQLAAMKPRAVDNLIEEELLYQESQKKEIAVDQKTLEAALTDIRGRYDSKENYLTFLKKMKLTEDAFTEKVRRLLAIRQLFTTQVDAKLQVPDEEVKAFYTDNPQHFKTPEQVRARHILIKLEADADKAAREAAMKKMAEIRKKIAEGEAFEDLAKQYSEGPSNIKGGDLGYFGRGQMVKPFEDAAFALAIGATSDIVETQFGLHLIRVEDKKEPGTVPYEKVRERIMEHLKKQKRNQAIATYLQDLKKGAKIEKF